MAKKDRNWMYHPIVNSECSLACRRMGCAAVAVAGGMLFTVPAAADDGLDTSTIASSEMMRNYDNASSFGAASVGAHKRAPGAPEPIRFGNFYATPELNTTAAFDNNIFRTAKDPKSDIRVEVVPVVNVTSKLPRHILNFAISGKLVSLLENDDQNYQDLGAKFSGALHIDHAHTLSVSVLSELEHMEKGLTFTPRDTKRPVPVFHNRAAVGLTRDAGRLFGTVSVSAGRKDYQDTEDTNNNPLDQDYRDTDLLTAQLRTGYRISPGFELIGQFRALRQLNEGNAFGSSQSTGYEATAGVQFQTSPLLRFHLLGGWGIRDFDRENMATLQTSLVEGGVEWLPFERLTFNSTVSRAISAEATDGNVGSVQTKISGKIDYDIFNNLVAHAGVSMTQAEFMSSDRQDTTYAANLGLDYYFTKNAAFTLGYAHEVRDSTIDDFAMSRDVVTIGAKLQF